MIENYSWAPNLGVVLGLRADGLSSPLILAINILSLVLSIYSISYMKHRIEDKINEYGTYYAFFLLFVAGMLGAVLSTNLIEFFAFYEFMLIPSYFLVAKWGYGEREKISLMYFLWTHVGAILLLIGILSTYALVGSFDIYLIPQLIEQIQPPFETTLWISILMFVAFFVKMALFGLHIWLPHVHAEAPTPISSLLSPAMIGIGGYAIVRIIISFYPLTLDFFRDFLSIWAVGTMAYGGIMALVQDDLKRRLAYSSISQMGYILLGISSFTVIGVSGSMFHYVSHATCKGLLFMVAGSIILQTDGLRSIKKLGGLASKMPITTIATIIGFFGIMGIPPLNGFHSEWMIFSGIFNTALHSESLLRSVIAGAGIVTTIFTVGYGLQTIQKIFFGPRPEYLENVKEAPIKITLPLIVLIFVTLLLGLFPSAIIDSISSVISSIFNG
jgi:NADH-quinone oxidoreductase subunit M